MTAKQILDAFSETLMQDDRILSPRERELLGSILQNSKTVSSPEFQSAVTATIGRSVGETVAQRAFALLGGSIVEQIVACSGMPAEIADATTANSIELRPNPQPPDMVPEPPASPQPPPAQQPGQAPHPPVSPKPSKPGPGKSPHPPSGPSAQRPLSIPVQQEVQRGEVDSSSVGVLEAIAPVRAQCVVLDEFLAPQELDELIGFTLQHEGEFQNSEVISPRGEPGVIDYNHRRSRVLMELGMLEEIILERIRGVLPRVLDHLGVEQFPVKRAEAQITASNDGDFFGEHSDDAQEMIASRRMTFVYFFHREPCQFEGGELRLHDSRWQGQLQIKTGSYQTVVPRQNQIVFFPCSLLHEITPVNCASRAFADSRFTLNGWLHK